MNRELKRRVVKCQKEVDLRERAEDDRRQERWVEKNEARGEIRGGSNELEAGAARAEECELKRELDVVVYDVEIAREVHTVVGEWNNPEGMGFASAVAYDYRTDRYHFFLHESGKSGLLNLLQGRVVVTFNGVKFDSRVILGNHRRFIPMEVGLAHISCPVVTPHVSASVVPVGTVDEKKTILRGTQRTVEWTEYDLLLKYVQARFGCACVREAEKKLGDKTIHDGSFGLDGLAEGTLGMQKTGHGAKAPLLYQQGLFGELLSYNLHDVRLTRKLLEFAWESGGDLTDRAGRTVQIDMGGI